MLGLKSVHVGLVSSLFIICMLRLKKKKKTEECETSTVIFYKPVTKAASLQRGCTNTEYKVQFEDNHIHKMATTPDHVLSFP